MTVTSLPQVQQAIYGRLMGDRPFMASVTGVFDAVPDGQAFPYIVIGDATEVPDRTLGQNGHQVTGFITVYTRDGAAVVGRTGSAGYATGLAIVSAAIELLTNEDGDDPLSVDGHDVVDVSVVSIDTSREKNDRAIVAQVLLLLEDDADA